jgi:long-chain acyl-CoA synthetase
MRILHYSFRVIFDSLSIVFVLLVPDLGKFSYLQLASEEFTFDFESDDNMKTVCDFVCLDTNFCYVKEILAKTPLKRVIVTNLAELLPWWKWLIGRGFNKIPIGKFHSAENIFRFKKLLKDGNASVLPSFKAEPEEMVEMLYTGGTTGLPKGVPFTNILFLEAAAEQRAVSERFIPKGEDIVVQGGPLFHILGQQVGLGGILSGDTVVLLPRVNLDGLFDHIQRYHILTFFGVPAMYRMIL